DGDGDGYVAGDCDDMRSGVHPGAEEVCGDGIDQNCDGVDPRCVGGDGGVIQPGGERDGSTWGGDGGVQPPPHQTASSRRFLIGTCALQPQRRVKGWGTLSFLVLFLFRWRRRGRLQSPIF
ncbi:MAG: putative metal-binding motif-containing protein, partial [Deltaproteobacteria bacterium]|nr:putative metal-binding motif-containing protein [Deltaproteobacteria bacterium]